ncbi:MAG: hypothetical protein HYR62_04580 [Actinobacteria bacterium]|nr:hypothetical protein [Actinomycetota bacterium]MBI3686505.1 hypothetical protein [Actinomycetota bacterium]
MKLQVDPELLAATAPPLRRAVAVADDLATTRRHVASGAVELGDESLARSVEEFLDAWSVGLVALARRGRTLADLIDLAVERYGAAEHAVGARTREAGS